MTFTLLHIASLCIILQHTLSCPSSIPIDVAFSSRSCDFRYSNNGTECLFTICYYKPSSSSKADPSGWKECFD